MNGAQCMDVADGYRCICDRGYKGVHCETGIAVRVIIHNTSVIPQVLSVIFMASQKSHVDWEIDCLVFFDCLNSFFANPLMLLS